MLALHFKLQKTEVEFEEKLVFGAKIKMANSKRKFPSFFNSQFYEAGSPEKRLKSVDNDGYSYTAKPFEESILRRRMKSESSMVIFTLPPFFY